MKFELEDFRRNIDEADLLDDLRAIHLQLTAQGVPFSYRSYNDAGRYTSSTMTARFGSWNKALSAAGIELAEEKNVTDIDLFLNLETVWESVGRQPVTRDMVRPHSKYSSTTYVERFGGWRQALKSFVEYISQAEEESTPEESSVTAHELESSGYKPRVRRTKRNISDRMRFRVLSRDGFTCQSCGASPLKDRGVELHVDHLVPWSKGGETEEANLSTKCMKCNLGKGNAFNE